MCIRDSNNGGNDPFGPTFTDLHSLGQNGNMWGIYYSQGGMANVSGETYGNGTYEFRADRNNGSTHCGKVFWRHNYSLGSYHSSWGTQFKFNRLSNGNYDDNPNDSTFPRLGYTKDGYLGSWMWIMLPTKIYLTGFTLCENWKYNQNCKDFRIYGRNSTDSGLNTSIQENRIYATESASDWNLIYEHKDEFDGEPVFFKNPGNIISDPQNAGPADTHTTFDKADVCHGRRIDFRKGASNVSQMEMYDLSLIHI